MRAVAVDWSGALKPANRLWLAEARAGVLRRLAPMATREQAFDEVSRYLDGRERVVVGLDFSFSFPEWFCRQHGVASGPEVWRLAASEGERWLRTCPPPFWGRPGIRKSPLGAQLRETEAEVAPGQPIAPKSTFQIGGAGAPGTGSIRGMPLLTRWRRRGFAVWPFDSPGRHTLVEIYPRLLTGAVVKRSAAARASYLARYDGALPASRRMLAAECEDAFDAAVSALVMDAHRDQLIRLPAGVRGGLEGWIWRPAMRQSGEHQAIRAGNSGW